MKQFLYLLAALLLSNHILTAQNTKAATENIKGSIVTSDGKPAAFVSVSIEQTNLGAVSNDKGEYLIKNIKPGKYTITVSAVATNAQQKEITVLAGQPLQVDFVLKENLAELKEVIISSRVLNKENKYVAKMPLKNLENPQVYSTVSTEILKQQGITSYDDAMRNVTGIARTWESTGRGGDGGAYFALRGFEAQPSLINGLPGLTSGNLDPANIEEIDVIKGPSGTLFGASFYGYGGIINTISKKPYYSFGGEVGYNFGSFGMNRFTADINTPLSKTEKIAMRVNAAYTSEGSFQDAGFRDALFIAPSLSYEVNGRLSFTVMTEFLQEERAVAPIFFNSDRSSPLDFKTIKELNLNNKLSFTSNDLTIKNPRYNMQAQMNYKLSDKWVSQTVISRGNVKSTGIYSYIWDDVPGDNNFSQYFHDEQQVTNTTDVQQNFNGDFKIGNMRNRLLVGLDYFSRTVTDNGSGWAYARNVTPQGGVNYVDPYSGDTLAPVYLNKASIYNLLANTEGSHSNISNSSYSAYASDVINITPALMAMVSLRGDYFVSKGDVTTKEDDYNQFALSPKFGLVYQPVLDKVSIFANYMNAFINVAPQQVADADGSNPRTKSFKPEHADQFELGVKANLFADRLGITISAYNIKLTDRVSPDPANIHNVLQGGRVRSKGIEFSANANPATGFNIIAGYSYNSIKILAGDTEDFYSEPGRNPGGQGPQGMANLWGTYKISNGKLRNFGIGLGGNYAGDYLVIDNSKTGVFVLPSYTLINSSLFYNADTYRITFNLNNITNKQYYSGYWSVNPQRQRNFAVSFAYKF